MTSLWSELYSVVACRVSPALGGRGQSRAAAVFYENVSWTPVGHRHALPEAQLWVPRYGKKNAWKQKRKKGTHRQVTQIASL
ncbi:hypothetical protein MRX96_030740 [Rhipicephalus microplus]